MNANVSTYLTQQIMTASPAKLVSMLYDKALVSLKETVASIERGDIETRWKANARAQEIVSHMWATLDREKGGDIASNLHQLFSFILARLPDVDLRNDPEPACEAIALLEPLASSWRTLATRGSKDAPDRGVGSKSEAAEPPPPMPTSVSA